MFGIDKKYLIGALVALAVVKFGASIPVVGPRVRALVV